MKRIVEKYFEQENGKDKIYYDKWTKREYRKLITKYYEDKNDSDDSDDDDLKDVLFTQTQNIFEKTLEDIEKEEMNDKHIIEFIKNNKNLKVLHIKEYNRIINKINTLENKLFLQNKKNDELINFKDNHKCDKKENASQKNEIDDSSDSESADLNISDKEEKVHKFNESNNIKNDNIDKLEKDEKSIKDLNKEIINIFNNTSMVNKDNIENNKPNFDDSENENSSSIESDDINFENTKSKKNKCSDIIVKRIIKFYNKHNEDADIIRSLSKGKGKINKIDQIKIDIWRKYNIINKNKVELIQKNYCLYKLYLENKKENSKNSFIKFLGQNPDIDRYNEKAYRCYKLFNDLFELIKNDKIEEDKKNNIIIDILRKCRFSIDKLYKIRENNYEEFINFLKNILIEKCSILENNE